MGINIKEHFLNQRSESAESKGLVNSTGKIIKDRKPFKDTLVNISNFRDLKHWLSTDMWMVKK